MIIIDIYFQLFSVIIFILMLLVLSYYLLLVSRLNNEIKNSKNIIQKIISELKTRLYDQDQKILDIDVRLNIAELRLSKFTGKFTDNNLRKTSDVFIEKPQLKVMSHSKSISQEKLSLTETEKTILDNLSYKDYTANELQLSLGKTREHTSRLLNKLFREGYITRSDNKKPYVYRLTTNNITFE